MAATGAGHMNHDDTMETKIAEIQHQLKQAGMDYAHNKFDKIMAEGPAEVFGNGKNVKHKRSLPTREMIGIVEETATRMRILADQVAKRQKDNINQLSAQDTDAESPEDIATRIRDFADNLPKMTKSMLETREKADPLAIQLQLQLDLPTIRYNPIGANESIVVCLGYAFEMI